MGQGLITGGGGGGDGGADVVQKVVVLETFLEKWFHPGWEGWESSQKGLQKLDEERFAKKCQLGGYNWQLPTDIPTVQESC